MSKYQGTGAVTSADYHAVKWVGKDKGGNAVTITLPKAINMGNIDWTFAEKDDVVAAVTFTAVYSNTDATSSSTTEPWTVEIAGSTAGAAEVLMGAGIFYIDNTAVALTRGGGSFNVEREFREINADGDRGPVEGRIVMEGSRASLTLNTLQILTRVSELYPALSLVTGSGN